MFGKDKDDTAHTGTEGSAKDTLNAGDRSSDAPSIISADMKVVGNLQSGGDVQVEGSVEGDLKSRTVTIGEKAHINGSINSETVNIRGRISGKVNAAAVRIAKTANVQGDINYQTLSIEEGAVIDGQIKRNEAGARSDVIKKPEVSATPIKASVPGDDKPAGMAPGATGMKPSGGKPLAS